MNCFLFTIFFLSSLYLKESYCIDTLPDPNNNGNGSQYHSLIFSNPFLDSSVLQFLFQYQDTNYNKTICSDCLFDDDKDIVTPDFYEAIDSAKNDNLPLAAFINLIVEHLNDNYGSTTRLRRLKSKEQIIAEFLNKKFDGNRFVNCYKYLYSYSCLFCLPSFETNREIEFKIQYTIRVNSDTECGDHLSRLISRGGNEWKRLLCKYYFEQDYYCYDIFNFYVDERLYIKNMCENDEYFD